MSYDLMNKIKPIPIDDQGRMFEALSALFKGLVTTPIISASATPALTMDDCFLIASAADAVVTVPTASEANAGKVFVVQFTNGTVTNAQVNDSEVSPGAVVVANAQYDIFVLISMGSPSLGSNGYFVLGIDGCAVATS